MRENEDLILGPYRFVWLEAVQNELQSLRIHEPL